MIVIMIHTAAQMTGQSKFVFQHIYLTPEFFYRYIADFLCVCVFVCASMYQIDSVAILYRPLFKNHMNIIFLKNYGTFNALLNVFSKLFKPFIFK